MTLPPQFLTAMNRLQHAGHHKNART